MENINEIIFYAFNNLAGWNDLFDSFVIFCADPLGYLLLGGLMVFLFTHKDKRKGVRDVTVVMTAALLAWLIAHAIKYFYYHPRPSEFFETYILFNPDSQQSFPSGHATFFSALAVALYFYHKKLAYVYGVGAVLIGFARIVGGVHWPFDILAGWVLGGCIAVVSYFLCKKLFEATP